jgi:2-hydroxy-6-oxonona-2,4-dienedioate hydrolase
VIVPDMPSFAMSPMSFMPQSAAEIAAPLVQAISDGSMPITRDIVGFSFGGLVGAELAACLPCRVERLVIVGSGGLATPRHHCALRPVKRGENDMPAHRHNLLALMLHRPGSVDALALHVQALNVGLNRLPVVANRPRIAPMILPDHLLRALKRTDVPVDAIWGEHDRPDPDPQAQFAALRAGRPSARLRVVKNAGHWCCFEEHEAFNRHCFDLLDQR